MEVYRLTWKGTGNLKAVGIIAYLSSAHTRKFVIHPGYRYRPGLHVVSGECELCGKPGRRVTDHCHKHMKVRGALCPSCNSNGEAMPLWYRGNCADCRYLIRLEVAQFEARHPDGVRPPRKSVA